MSNFIRPTKDNQSALIVERLNRRMTLEISDDPAHVYIGDNPSVGRLLKRDLQSHVTSLRMQGYGQWLNYIGYNTW
jgi:hypothetical protein